MKAILLFFTVTLLPGSALAQAQPIQKTGYSCPLDYYISGNYCIPSAGNRSKWSIPKEDRSCPLGSYVSGNYCTKSYAR
jgi:hypothetical protein